MLASTAILAGDGALILSTVFVYAAGVDSPIQLEITTPNGGEQTDE